MSQSTLETRLTDEEFWEEHWVSQKIPARVNQLASFDRCLSRVFTRFLADGQGKKMIEIGAAPGRWLMFFREKFGYEVDGIEYLPSACRKTEENLAACGIEGRIFQQDFFHNTLPKHSYDVVLSIGFIEHFTDQDTVIEGHVALLKPGGLLVLIVPNLRGLHGALERLMDLETLAAHNQEVMSVPFMEGLAIKHQMAPLWIGYTAGITPGLLSVADDRSTNAGGIAANLRRKRVVLLRFVLRLLRYVRSGLLPLDYLNGPHISSYLTAVYRYTSQKEEEPARSPEQRK